MARPIEYDREEVLDQALQVFWRLGHAGCSIQVLTNATGLSRQGIYNTFGDKNGFFRAVVAHYVAKVEGHCRLMSNSDATLETLRSYIKETLALHRAQGSGACLIVTTAFSWQSNDEHIKPALNAGTEGARRRLRAMDRSDCLATRPRDISCRSSSVSANRDRVRVRGLIPPARSSSG